MALTMRLSSYTVLVYLWLFLAMAFTETKVLAALLKVMVLCLLESIGSLSAVLVVFFSKKKTGMQDAFNKFYHGAQFGRHEWFALYKDDWNIDDGTWINGVHRGLFRLHPGTVSEGCITIAHNSDFAMIRNALMNTSLMRVPCMRALMAHGWIEVVANGSNTCP